jgi:ribosomal protein S18 acetylase RimI-like enzyme
MRVLAYVNPNIYNTISSKLESSFMFIQTVTSNERSQLLAIASSTKLFTPDEAEALLGEVLDGIFSGALPPEHQAVCCRATEGGDALGWSYFAPDQYAEGIWNVWWIGVQPSSHGTGAGKQLLRAIEAKVESAGGRVMIIETSDSDAFARARKFYSNEGYSECGRVPEFYGESEGKVIFARRPRKA